MRCTNRNLSSNWNSSSCVLVYLGFPENPAKNNGNDKNNDNNKILILDTRYTSMCEYVVISSNSTNGHMGLRSPKLD